MHPISQSMRPNNKYSRRRSIWAQTFFPPPFLFRVGFLFTPHERGRRRQKCKHSRRLARLNLSSDTHCKTHSFLSTLPQTTNEALFVSAAFSICTQHKSGIVSGPRIRIQKIWNHDISFQGRSGSEFGIVACFAERPVNKQHFLQNQERRRGGRFIVLYVLYRDRWASTK